MAEQITKINLIKNKTKQTIKINNKSICKDWQNVSKTYERNPRKEKKNAMPKTKDHLQ